MPLETGTSGVVLHNQEKTRNWRDRADYLFVDREFIMRSQGQVRFINIGARFQKIVATSIILALLVWGASLGAMSWSQYRAQAERSSLLQREAQVATAEDRVSEYRENIGEVASDLKRRQDFIEEMTKALPEDIKAAETVSDSSGETAELVDEVSLSIPEAAALARIEARQLSYVERLTRFADRRSAAAERAMRRLGLDPKAMLANASRDAMGGPLEQMFTGADGEIDQRFERLGLSLARMAALERGLDGIPQFSPASAGSISSGFGYRRDPFNGGGAMHSGLDFRGPTGAPIYSAAKGTVSFVGWKSGYGKVVEVSHGNGLMTRYAHMSRHKVTRGQKVAAGSVIGAIGSTGRSTGPHLHFEVRVNNRAVNPRTFLEVAPHVLKETRGRTAHEHGTDGE